MIIMLFLNLYGLGTICYYYVDRSDTVNKKK